MATKLDSISAEESQHAPSPISKPASSNAAGGSKVSMFGVKSGFVIPKNKLSGSLVPIVRGGGKVEAGDVGKEDSTKQVQRKTRWGADPTQDAAVRKGRSLAYQTRLEQMTEQLKSGSLEPREDQDLQSPGQASDVDSVAQLHRRELLELEKREVIGEILRLNPGYKAPSDYKPLLKEARVPIPLKAQPGNNFIGLILGPSSNTQKRLEEETGAKVRVYGIKTNTKEKCEITRSDATEAQAVYEELFVHISADTYEKVDAAVALIELLVTPVSVSAVASATSSSVTGDSVIDQSKKDSTSAHMTMPVGVANQATVQRIVLPAHSVQPQFQAYAGPWHLHGPPNVATPHATGFIPSPVLNNMQFPPPINLLNAPFSGGRPALGTVPRNSSVVTRPEPPMQNLQRPLNQLTAPPSHANAIQQPPPVYPAMPAPTTPILPAVSPAVPAGSMPVARPTHLGPQPMPTPGPGGFMYNRPLSTPSGSSSGFPAAPLPLRPNNMIHMVPPSSIPLQRPHPLVPQNNVGLPSQPNVPPPAVSGSLATNFNPRASFPHRSSVVLSNSPSAPHVGQVPAAAVGSSPVGPLPATSPAATFLPARMPTLSPRPLSGVSASPPAITSASPQVSARVPTQSAPLSTMRPPITVLSLPSSQASIPASLPGPSHQPIPSISGSALGNSQSFLPPKPSMAGPGSIPPITSPKPQQPSPGDFTFQPHRPQVSASVTSPLPSSQPAPHTISQAPLNQNASQLPLGPPKAPSFRPAAQNPPIPVGMPGLPRPQSVAQMGPPQGPLQPPSSAPGVPFPANPTSVLSSPRVPTFLNANTPPSAQVGLRNLGPAVPNVSSSIASRPTTLVQAHNQPPPGHQPHGLVAPNQPIASSLSSYVPGKPASTPGGSQIYDPFSPTSISSGPRQQEDDPAKARKPETDAEYEDLMASVGVR